MTKAEMAKKISGAKSEVVQSIGQESKEQTALYQGAKEAKPEKKKAASKAPKAGKKEAPAKAGGKVKTSGKKAGPVEIVKPAKVEIIDPKALQMSTERIVSQIANVSQSFLVIGYELQKVRESGSFKAGDFKNVYEYGEATFGFKKSSVANFISVCEKFSLHTAEGKPTDVIAPEFCNFNYTQLTVLASLPAPQMAGVTPDMSVRQIKAAKKSGAVDEKLSKLDEPDEGEGGDEKSPVQEVCIFSKILTDGNYDEACDLLMKCFGKRVNIVAERPVK